MLKIEVSENSGFCFGVKRAVNRAEELSKDAGGKLKIYTYGPIIHNEIVVKDLESKGVFSIENLESAAAGSIVIIRSHGVPPQVYREAEEKGIILEDVTCPFVAEIHKKVTEESENGRKIIIVGDEAHPEVIGIRGWCVSESFVVRDKNDLQRLINENIIKKGEYSVVAQTTIKVNDFNEVTEYLRECDFDLRVFNTICKATELRQKSCLETSRRVDMMLVIGSESSSNTKKLLEIASKQCKKTYLIQTLEDLPLNEVEKCGTIGIAAGASAPECIIKEVIASMSELHEQNEMYAYMDDIEKSLRLPGRGEVVTGEIIAVSEKEIIVNVGCKKDGIIPKDEVSLEPGQKLTDVFHVGDEIEAKVVKTKDDDGNILLSKKKLEVNEHWNEVNEAMENKEVIEVKVTAKVKGGVIAAFKEVSGFIPLSQLSDKFTEDVDEFIGKTIPVKVIQTNPKRNRAVFSHRAVLMEEKAKRTEAFWNSIDVDDIVDGVVKRFTDYGAFVDIGGVDGLLHISEISWGKIKKPQDVLELEQKVKVKILSMNREKGKISLGLKQTVPEPWENIESKYQVGDIIEGKVVQLKEYGAFIEIEPGLDGLVHISEIAYKRVASPANELEIGQTVNAKILDIDTEKKRISLSIKETLDKPVVEDAPVEEPVEE